MLTAVFVPFGNRDHVAVLAGLYLPPHAVAVQLVPFGRPVNFDEFGALLAARGPYLEWHNTIKVPV